MPRIAAGLPAGAGVAEHCVTVVGADTTARPAHKAWLAVDGVVVISDRDDAPVAEALDANLAVLRAKAARTVVAAAVLRRDHELALAPPVLRDAPATVRALAQRHWVLLPLAMVVLHLDPLSVELPDGSALEVGPWLVPEFDTTAGAIAAAAASVRLRAPDTLADLLRVVGTRVGPAPDPRDIAGWVSTLG